MRFVLPTRYLPYVFFAAAVLTGVLSGAYGEGSNMLLAFGWLCYSALLTYFGWDMLDRYDDDDDGPGEGTVIVPDAPPSEWVVKE